MRKVLKLFVLNSKPSDPNGYIFQALIRSLRRRVDLQLHVVSCDDLRQVQIDPNNQALLVYGGEELHVIPNEYIQRPFGRRAIWFTEDPYEVQRNQHSSALFHIVFTNDSGSLNHYHKGLHLPLAGDSGLIPKRRQNKVEKLLFFSGTAWPNRKRLLNSLITEWPKLDELDLHLVANQFVEQQFALKGLAKPLRFEDPISISDFCLRASNSLCTLVVGRDFSGSGQHKYSRSPGPRLFEAGITGSCQLVHASEIPDMPTGLEDGSHYLRFSSTSQLVDLLRQARTNPEPFQSIGREMAAVIMGQHTYDQRADLIVNHLMSCKLEDEPPQQPSLKIRVLFISHEQTKTGFHYGGAGICLDKIVEASPVDVDVRILCCSGDVGHSFTLFDGSGEPVGGFRCQQNVSEFSLHHSEFEKHFENLLDQWKPHLVHANHLLGFVPAILPLSRKAGARTSITLHDYYTICDSWNLLDSNNKFCDIDNFFDERCQSCCSIRRPQFRSVDPIRRRIVMSEALAYAQAVIVPSESAQQQLRKVFPHLPETHIIEPAIQNSVTGLMPADGSDLVVLVPGNLAINKGYLELRSIIELCNDLSLPIQFRILGRIEDWIEKELTSFSNVIILGRYDIRSFITKAQGSDLALFLSPWPETYCITFDEWKTGGRPCFYHSIGALAEAHRKQGLHQASQGFALDDHDGLMSALIQSSTPEGLKRLREPCSTVQSHSPNINFGLRHWSVFHDLLNHQTGSFPNSWAHYQYQQWTDDFSMPLSLTTRQKLKLIIYRLPFGHKLASLWRQMRAR